MPFSWDLLSEFSVLVAELLSADGGFKHETGRIHREDDNAVGELGVGGGAGFDRGGGGLCVERIVSVLESPNGFRGLEDQNLGVVLAAELRADRALGHIAVPDGGAVQVDVALAIGSANADGSFANAREDGISG